MGKDFNWRTPVIAIDFDGCLCRDHYPEIGAPNWEVIMEAKRLQKAGACLILWTCREGERLEAAVEACRGWGLEFDEVNANAKHLMELFGNDCRKISADEYWDDRSVYMGPTLNHWRNIRGACVTLRSREKVRQFINEALRPEIEVMRGFGQNGIPAEIKKNYFEGVACLLSEALEQMEFLIALADEHNEAHAWYKHGYEDATKNAASWLAGMFEPKNPEQEAPDGSK